MQTVEREPMVEQEGLEEWVEMQTGAMESRDLTVWMEQLDWIVIQRCIAMEERAKMELLDKTEETEETVDLEETEVVEVMGVWEEMEEIAERCLYLDQLSLIINQTLAHLVVEGRVVRGVMVDLRRVVLVAVVDLEEAEVWEERTDVIILTQKIQCVVLMVQMEVMEVVEHQEKMAQMVPLAHLDH
jgi:hypothetical protein